MKLAEMPLQYPTYVQLMESGSPINWRRFNGIAYTPAFTDRELSTFLNPETDVKKRAYEGLLTWLVLTSIVLSYVKHDRTDLKGGQASELAEEFMDSVVVQKIKTCKANLVSGAAYFDKYADCPLLCQYGQIGGQDPKDRTFFLSRETFIPVQDNFKGGLLIKYSHEESAQFIDPDKNLFRDVVRFDRRVYEYWTFLNMTWIEPMGRTAAVGRQLLA